MQVSTNTRLAEPAPPLATDGEVSILFCDPHITPCHIADALDSGCWQRLPEAFAPHILIRQDGKMAIIRVRSSSTNDAAVHVRRVVPFAAALQGKVVLHASAIQYNSHVFAFVGASRVGKSTLAKQCERFGLPIIADDLLPCWSEKQNVMVPLTTNTTAPLTQASLGSVYFLRRDRGLAVPECRPLSQQACFQHLAQNGFGELAVAEIWQTQFLMYHHIAQNVPAFQLVIPDDLTKLTEAIKYISSHVFHTARQTNLV